MLDVMERYPGVFSGIAIVDWEAERADETMLQLAEQGVRGFRIYPTDTPIENWLDGSGFEQMFATGAAHNLALCPLINPDRRKQGKERTEGRNRFFPRFRSPNP